MRSSCQCPSATYLIGQHAPVMASLCMRGVAALTIVRQRVGDSCRRWEDGAGGLKPSTIRLVRLLILLTTESVSRRLSVEHIRRDGGVPGCG